MNAKPFFLREKRFQGVLWSNRRAVDEKINLNASEIPTKCRERLVSILLFFLVPSFSLLDAPDPPRPHIPRHFLLHMNLSSIGYRQQLISFCRCLDVRKVLWE